MYTTRNQEATLQVSRGVRSLQLGLMSGWLLVGLAVANLIGGLLGSDSRLRYPSAEPLETHFQFDTLATGVISQQSAYQSADDLPQVLGWYIRHVGLSHDLPQGDDCVTMTRVEARLFFQQSLTVTLCAQSQRTLIFVNRSLAVR